MSYDDPPEPTLEEEQEYHTARNAKPGVLRIEGLTRADVHATILGVLRGDYDRELKAELGKLLEEVKAKLRKMIDKEIAAKLRGALTEAIKP